MLQRTVFFPFGGGGNFTLPRKESIIKHAWNWLMGKERFVSFVLGEEVIHGKHPGI
ncbi:MAG: hypothetical protein CM1200mP10_24060 [Candidatus Neomarinimicrobiota bacterium]|nr:MAG: hypothetical protein CM1200mP10_24060 [Candidatus Neomarinimicrobiota bacterium]